MERAVRVIISGRVQGVCFRAHTKERADELGVRGYVRNLSGGTVEVVVVGSGERVEAFLVFCRMGPSAAKVDGVEVSELSEATQSQLQGFEIRW